MRWRLLITVTALALVSQLAAATAGPVKLRRFALIVGANSGGGDRVQLRYAASDARKIAGVLRDLGGVDRTDLRILSEPSVAGFREALAQLRSELGQVGGGVRREVILYYSGHSDEEGLLLSGERFSYAMLRDEIRGLPAEVSIAILDSCSSGAFTRAKGGVRRPSFLIDDSVKVSGHAFLSSSSANEAAQESDRLAASFFTHYLISGLRGGADDNGDGQVTLGEAYRFTFAETVARTETSQLGPQHPAYDLHLVGSGDLVMTDLRSGSSSLSIGADISGRLFVRNPQGQLVAELFKPAGREVILAVGPSSYQVTLIRGGKTLRASIDVVEGASSGLTMAQFSAVETEATVARGTTATPPGQTPPDAPPPGPTDSRPVRFSLVSFDGLRSDEPVADRFAFNLIAGGGAHLHGVEIGGLVNMRSRSVRGLQVAGGANLNQGTHRAIQLAGMVNWQEGPGSGIMAAGAGNWHEGPMVGIQAGGAGNWNDGPLRGVQLGGMANVASGPVEGLQMSGGVNIGGDRLHGVQLGVVNVGGAVRGAQIGLVNVATTVRGAQIGLVNVADENHGLPLAVINAYRRGYRRAELFASDIAPVNVGLKYGSDHVYTMAAGGAREDLFLLGLGLGVHLPRPAYYLDFDLGGYGLVEHDLSRSDYDFLAQLRAMIGVPVAEHVAIFGGLSMSAAFAFEARVVPLEEVSIVGGKLIERGELSMRLSPGMFAGVAF